MQGRYRVAPRAREGTRCAPVADWTMGDVRVIFEYQNGEYRRPVCINPSGCIGWWADCARISRRVNRGMWNEKFCEREERRSKACVLPAAGACRNRVFSTQFDGQRYIAI